jgi:hypothetical protein
MKYNSGYRKLSLAPINVDPSPSTREGTHSLVERFLALRDTEGRGGGMPGSGSFTSLVPVPPKKSKKRSLSKDLFLFDGIAGACGFSRIINVSKGDKIK